jgi:predicted DCC family thiol-disulfide oxidoreductase YuxK
LTVLYDEQCAMCRRSADWLLEQPCFVPMVLLPAGSQRARELYGSLPWFGDQLIVVSDSGEVWAGTAAFLVCLWATAEYRELSLWLSTPGLAPLAERFFRWVSAKRGKLSALFDHSPCGGPACHRGACTLSPYR